MTYVRKSTYFVFDQMKVMTCGQTVLAQQYKMSFILLDKPKSAKGKRTSI